MVAFSWRAASFTGILLLENRSMPKATTPLAVFAVLAGVLAAHAVDAAPREQRAERHLSLERETERCSGVRESLLERMNSEQRAVRREASLSLERALERETER